MMNNSEIARRRPNVWRTYVLARRFRRVRPVEVSAWKGEVRVYRIFVVFFVRKVLVSENICWQPGAGTVSEDSSATPKS